METTSLPSHGRRSPNSPVKDDRMSSVAKYRKLRESIHEAKKSGINDTIKYYARQLSEDSAVMKSWKLRLKITKLEWKRAHNQRALTLERAASNESIDYSNALEDCDKAIAEKGREWTIIEEHIELVQRSPEKVPGRFQRMFFRTHWTSSFDLNQDLSVSNYANVQSNLRQGLISRSDAFDEIRANLWCPIEGEFFSPDSVNAVHIFPVSQGRDMMEGIFAMGHELLSLRNGFLITAAIKQFFDKGKLFLIPDTDLEDPDAVAKWIKLSDRPWVIKLVNINEKERRLLFGSCTGRRIGDLDGSRVIFRNDLQPRDRYLYWHYLRCMTTSSHGLCGDKSQKISEMKGKVAWATSGKWMGKGMLHEFALHRGQDFVGALAGVANPHLGIKNGAPISLLEWSIACANYQAMPAEVTGEPVDDEDYDNLLLPIPEELEDTLDDIYEF